MSNTTRTVDVNGKEASIVIIKGDSQYPTESVMAELAMGKIAYDKDDLEDPNRAIVEKASTQLEQRDVFAQMGGYGAVSQPSVRPEYCTRLYRSGGMHKACIDAKVSDTVGLGWRIRPRAELFPRASDLQPGAAKPNIKEQAVVEDFLDLGLENGSMESFTDINVQMALDYESAGQGYVEIARDDSGAVNGLFSVKGETFRIAAKGPQDGFWQNRNGKWRYFAPYTGKQGVKVAGVVSKAESTDDGVLYVPLRWSFDVRDGEDIPRHMDFVSKAGEPDNVRANEILMFKRPTPKDTHYGEPDIIAGIEDYLIAQGVRLFVRNYFDAGAIPRLILYMTGEEQLSDELLKQLSIILDQKGSINTLNSMPMLRLPEGTTIGKLPLTDSHLTDNSSMLSLRDRSELYVAMAHRVPLSALPAIIGEQTVNRATSDSANRRYVSSVIRPRQRYIEDRWNFMFRKELGIRDWVLDFEIPDLLDTKTKYEIWQIGISNGWLSINEVRAQLNLPPVKGGENPALRIAGQGIIPVPEIENVKAGAKPGDLMATGNQKTPSKEDLVNGKAIMATDREGPAAWLVPTAEWPEMPEDEHDMVAKAVEELVVNKDEVPVSREKVEEM
jgi:capsid portal protein